MIPAPPPAGLPISPLLPQGGQAQPIAAPPQSPQGSAPYPFDADQEPEGQVAGSIDPEVLARPVKINIKGSSRMLSRQALQQMVPLIGQIGFNGPFLAQINQLGLTFDFLEFFKLIQDATGLGKAYHFIRPMSPQEQQAHQTPPPQAQLQQSMQQQSDQTRIQLGQLKAQTEAQKVQTEAQVEQYRTQEESARHIASLLQKDRDSQRNQPDPQVNRLEMAKKAQEIRQSQQVHQQNLLANAQRNKLDLATQAARSQQDLQTTAQKHALAMAKAREVLGASIRDSRITNAQSQITHQQKLNQNNETHRQKLELARKAQAATVRQKSLKPPTKPQPR